MGSGRGREANQAVAARDLATLERLRLQFGPPAAARKRLLLQRLARATLGSAAAVRRLHEVLCFLRAYPDDAHVLAQAARLLDRFARRADLQAFRADLAGSGIDGTAHWFPYFYPTARWLARCWPEEFVCDRGDEEAAGNIDRALPQLVGAPAAAALAAAGVTGFAAVDAVRGRYTDAVWLVQRAARLPGTDAQREALFDAINPSCHLLPGARARNLPSRTRDGWASAPLALNGVPLAARRPAVRAQLARPPAQVGPLGQRAGAHMVDLARRVLATRQRDLDAFAWGNARDVWLIDDADGLQFALIGLQPARRAPIAALYGALYLKNGVPIGYGQSDHVGPACALSFNLFDTFRGAALAAHVLARLMAALQALLGARSFSLEPYQLGNHNDEAIASGAWWFYFKLGWRPRDPATRHLAGQEVQRMQRTPAHRSSAAVLRQLARQPLFFETEPGATRPLPALAALQRAAQRELVRRDPIDLQRAAALCAQAAATALQVKTRARWSASERAAWLAWAPLLLALRVARWRADERHAIAALVRLKGAAGEAAFVRATAQHQRLLAALFTGPSG